MKNKYLILLAVMIIVVLLFLHLSSNSVAEKIDKIERYDKKIKVAQEKLNSAKVLNQQLKGVSKVILNSMTNKKYFATKEVNEFVKKLTNLADRYKIPVQSINPKAAKLDTKYLAKEQYSLQLNCTYVQLGKFLTDLESFNHIIKVNTLEVEPLSGNRGDYAQDKGETRYEVNLQLATYKIIKEA